MLTLIIPTHERHAYLSRVLEYYEDTNFSLIVVDSSKDKYVTKIDNSKVHYIHCPYVTWPEKLLMAVGMVETKYIAMCADDDFVAKTAFFPCLSFLESNLDYQQVQGYMLGFKNQADRIEFELIYPHAYEFDVNHDYPLQRLESFYKNYVQTFYVVRRRNDFKEALLAIKQWDINGKMIDQMISTYTLINGKMKVMPIFFGAREYITNSHSQSLVSLEDIYQKVEYRPLVDRFFLAVAQALSNKSKITTNESETAFRKIYSNWISNRNRRARLHTLIFGNCCLRRLFKVIKYLQERSKKKIYNAYGIQFKGDSRELVLIDEHQNNELQTMKYLINKHAIKSL